MRATFLLVVLAGACALADARPTGQPAAALQITAVDGITVGHHTLTERPTGCTVVLAEAGAVGSVEVLGGAPGTIETDLLAPENLVDQVHGVFMAGGSAFGLDVAGGVRRYLSEKKVGFEFGGAYVPIVPGAIIFDLPVGGRPDIRPGADCGYAAAKAASAGAVAEGNVGAGAGATVGKFLGRGRAMKGGVGSAALRLPSGLVVGALATVNASGSIIDPATGRVVAGVRTADGTGLEDVRGIIRGERLPQSPAPENTTVVIVATNARLTKAQANAVAKMAQAGLARAVLPVYTLADGDTVFVLATGTWSGDVDVSGIGALAAEAVSDAILRGVRAATGIPGYPAARDIARR
ncbi:MAG TPA: P1 family peptidase [Vicinamibacterales bacterium]|nr:P1 family peptidase [Vicinamibacterales bacterium]